MTNNDVLRRAIRCALVANVAVTAAGFASGATAAPAGPPEPTATDTSDTPALQEVIVTGSRIKQPGLEAISPVTTVTSEEIKAQGVTRIEDLLNSLPQVFADQGSAVSNGATGEATVNLRNLGTQRTLVLVNGRRLMPGDPTIGGNSAPDLNNIPAALVERVDVLTGGASATYGADAVAGVVNFIMNDHFEGVRIDANAAMNDHHQHDTSVSALVTGSGYPLPSSSVNDGKTKDMTIIMGSDFAEGKGNVEIYATYRRIDAVLQAARDFSSCSLNPSMGGTAFACGGSSTSATGRFIPLNNSGDFTVGPGGAFVPWESSKYEYNYAPLNYYQRPDERWTAGSFLHLDVSEHQRVYGEFMFMHDDSTSQEAPGGAFLGDGTAVGPTGIPNGAVQTNCANPELSASELAALCGGSTAGTAQFILGRRNVEGGPRSDDLQHTSFRIVMGTNGDIGEAWKYDAYAMEAQTLYADNGNGNLSKAFLANSLVVVPGTGTAAGTNVCASGGTCVPYNIFAPGGVTAAALSYLQIPTITTGTTEERVVSANLTGDLGKYGVTSPFATNGLAVNVGAEWRSEHVVLHPDEEQIENDVAGAGNPVLPLTAGFSVAEVFTEARMELIQDKPFAKELSVETGYRYSDYTIGFDTNTYKFGVDYSPTSDVRFRGSYQRAVRAPNLQELFQQKYVGLDGSADPCASTSSSGPPTATRAQCARTGVTAAQYGTIVRNSAGQYNGLIGGNPNLKPEQSDTTSFGLVITPSFVPALSMTIDYFNIKIKNVISSYGANFSINQCLTTGNPEFCSLIHRDASGSLWLSTDGYVNDPTLNLGSLQTRGADIGADYKLDLGAGGHLEFTLNGTYTAQLITQPLPGSGSYDCAGYFGNTCGTPTPKWRHKLRTTWSTPYTGLAVSAQWRHINSVIEDTESPNALLAASTNAVDAKLGSREYLDLTAAYQVNKIVSVRVGVNNVLDKDPPIIAGGDFSSAFSNGNTYPQVYDSLGRYMFVNVTADF